jgi:hypothetical protein
MITPLKRRNSRQWTNNAGNPASVANGTGAYDSHIYYSFGDVSSVLVLCLTAPLMKSPQVCGSQGCVEATLSSHITFACSGGGGRVRADAAESSEFAHPENCSRDPRTSCTCLVPRSH